MLSDLRYNLERIANSVRADWGIYVKFLANGEEIAVNADAPMDTMSVIKIPIITCFFNAHHRGIWAHLEDAVARMSEKVWDAQCALQL
jgi:beta-lactamase class A